MFVVPIAERVALLSGRGLSDRLIEEGSLVKIRNGDVQKRRRKRSSRRRWATTALP